MTISPNEVKQLVRKAMAAVREARGRSHLYAAWELLQERDAEGEAKGALPYTEPALAELAAAHARDPEDTGVVHHLAIAHHARAWDLELQADPRAAAEWERALGYWRNLAASSDFWAGLKIKLEACDPQADARWLAEARQNLMENLLDIHVDFVRHYTESGALERASAHVEIVKRARIPPAIQKRLTGKVFEVMTGAVPAAKAAGDYTSALVSLERFLELFPDHLPALRLHAEVCQAALQPLSFQNQWDKIMELNEQAWPLARRLAEHPELAHDPLARSALAELACECAQYSLRRSEKLIGSGDAQPLEAAQRDAACEACELGIRWGRLAAPHSPEASQLKMYLAGCLNTLAHVRHQEAQEVWAHVQKRKLDYKTGLQTMQSLYRVAVADLEEAVRYRPGDPALAANLQGLTGAQAQIETAMVQLDGPPNLRTLWNLLRKGENQE